MGARNIAFTVPAAPVEDVRSLAYVSADTLAQLLDVSATTVWEWTRKGTLPKPVKIGGSSRWHWLEVEKRLKPGSTPEDDDPILRASRGG